MVSHAVMMPMFAPELVLLIGLGVGVDYALFIVSRHRQGLQEGHSAEESIVNAVNTSGRAVFFAGIIVCVALLGMFALGVNFLYGLAIAASIGVAFTMMAALTLLPAILGFLGPHILSRRQQRSIAAAGPRAPRPLGTRVLGPLESLHRPTARRAGHPRPGHHRHPRDAVLLDVPGDLRRGQ